MSFPNLQRPAYGVSVTVTSSAQSLLALIHAVSSPAQFYTNVQGSCRSWNVQLDPDSGQDVYLGDDNVSTSSCGIRLQSGGGFLDRASIPGMAPIGSIFAVTASGSSKLNIFVFPE